MDVRISSYRFLLIVIFITIFSFVYSNANVVETLCFPDKIVIRINYLQTSLEKNDSSDKYLLKIDNSLPAYRINDIVKFDELHFNLALPRSSQENVYIRNLSYKSFGKLNKSDFSRFQNFNLKFSAKISDNGISRGVPVSMLVVNPFEFDPVNFEIKALQSAEIVINLPYEIYLSEPQIYKTEKGFFSSILNKKHLNYFLNQRYIGNKRKDIILSAENWYSPSKTYLKITTRRDGIAYLNGSDIIQNENSFLGKETKYFHLLYRGKEYPLYFLNDSDGFLDEADKILFIGSRPIGDTTWFNIFTNENDFYLIYDETSLGDRLEQFGDVGSPIQSIEKVKINNHIEYDKDYSRGYEDTQLETETVEGEGWFWGFISPNPDDKLPNRYEKQTFTYSTLLNNDLKLSDSITIRWYIRSRQFFDSASRYPYHIVKSIINDDTIDTYLIPHRKAFIAEINYPQNKLNAGINKLMLKEFNTKNDYNAIQLPDEVWIDYITVEGLVFPYAFNGKSDFSLDYLYKDSELMVKGFNSDKIYVVDTSKKTIEFPGSEIGSFIRATSINGKFPMASIILNDSVLCDTVAKGFYVAVMRYPDYKPEYKFYNQYENVLKNDIQEIPDSSIVCLMNNTDDLLSQEVRNAIKELGSKEINTRVPGQSWIFVIKKGNPATIIEKRETSGITQVDDFLKHIDGKSYIAKIKLPKGSPYNLVCRDESSVEHASVYKVNTSNLKDSLQQADLIIITHNNFRETADSLAHYREKTHRLKYKVVDIEDIYKEFSYGIKTPLAIKEFLKYAYYNWKKPAPAYLILIGDASWDYRMLTPNAKYKDYVPSYGWPASDFWFTQLDGNDLYPEMIAGRIPIWENSQGLKYIDKLMEYDTIQLKPWMKKFLFLSGGKDGAERGGFYDFIFTAVDYLLPPPLCADTSSVKKVDSNMGGELESGEIISKINSGKIWVNFLGHSSPTLFDMDGWNVSKLNNKPKYSFLTTLGCNSGAFLEPDIICRNEEYLLEPEKGMICVAGPTNVSFVDFDKKIMMYMYIGMTDTELNLRQIGDILTYAKSNMYNGGYERLTPLQFTLLGDPLVRLKIKTTPDLYIVPDDITVENKNGESVITENDSLAYISGYIYNGGITQNDSVEFRIIREYENHKDTFSLVVYGGICLEHKFKITIPVFDMPGKHKITLEIDPYNLLNDSNPFNNIAEVYFEVFSQALVPLEPLPYWDVRESRPVFRVIDPVCDKDIEYSFEIRQRKDFNVNPIYKSTENEITNYGSYIEWNPVNRLNNINVPYWLVGYKRNKTGITGSKELWVPFSTVPSWDSASVKFSIRGEEQLKNLQLEGLSVYTINDTARLTFEQRMVPFQVIGVFGIRNVIEREAEIKLDDKSYVTGIGGQAPRGLNIVVASGIDGSFKMKRNYDTWGKPNDGVRFVKFLKDSVGSMDYVLIASCDAAFRVFWDTTKHNPSSIGSFDSLRYYLRLFGSRLADSIKSKTNVDPNSFVMVGKRYAPVGSIFESLDTTGGIAQISDSIITRKRQGEFSTPIIGPAKLWKNVSLSGKLDNENVKHKITVVGLPYNKSGNTVLIENDSSAYIDLSEISAKNYPYIKINSQLERVNDTSLAYITSINSVFSPLPELAFSKDKCEPKTDSIMRGETINEYFVVRNISNRTGSDNSILSMVIISQNNPSKQFDTVLPSLYINEESKVNFLFETEKLETMNNITANLSLTDSTRDIYTFNNSEKRLLDVIEDKIKPYIIMKLDGKEVKDGDYVSIKPFVEISIYDNSILPLSEKNIDVRINAMYIPKTSDYNWQFNGKEYERPLKADVSFISDSLDTGENIFTVMFSDASGNKDTVRVSVFVSLNGYVEKIKNYPNPFESGTTFNFYFKAPHQNSKANIDIYNVSGQKITSIKKAISIGDNSIEWNGLDDSGNGLPIGMYFYRLSIESDFYVDPQFGKFVIMR